MTLTDLADRVEGLTGPCREMDALIFEAIGLTSLQERHCKDWCRQNGRTDLTRAMYVSAWAPDFTRSLDAAMTLLPPNHRWLMNGPDMDGAGDDIKPCASVLPYGESLTHPQDSHEAATPALAFLSAVLHALAALEASRG